MEYISRLKAAMHEKNIAKEQIEMCVEYAAALRRKCLPVIFDKKHLHQILRIYKINMFRYHSFFITNKSKSRYVCAPGKMLKTRQQWILKNILEYAELSDNCHGFVKNRSILTNAERHLGKKYILNMDIKDFFPSITHESVINVFKDFGYTTPVSQMLAELCTYRNEFMERVLPQGAPTSPALANIYCKSMDAELERLAVERSAVYTRYADDITFSSDNELVSCISEIEKIFRKYGFRSNREKTRLIEGERRKMVTGLVVSDDIRVPKSFKRKLKQEIYYCKKFGVAAHLENSKVKKCANYREHLYGKAYYVKMVEPEIGERFLSELDSIEWT